MDESNRKGDFYEEGVSCQRAGEIAYILSPISYRFAGRIAIKEGSSAISKEKASTNITRNTISIL